MPRTPDRATDFSVTIADYFGLKTRFKDLRIGVEIETEGLNLPDFNNLPQKHWMTHGEGSLRNNGMEHITHPFSINEIDKVFKVWDEHTVLTEFTDSIRTSVHIHYNVLHMSLNQVLSVVAAYWFLENILVHLNGMTRVGNLFCLRVQDAEQICQSLCNDVKMKVPFRELSSDGFRYAALNIAALRKFGTMEFRFLRGYHESNIIKTWVKELHSLVENASQSASPSGILTLYRNTSPSRFLQAFFSKDFVNRIYDNIDPPTVNRMLKENETYVERLVNACEFKPKSRVKKDVYDEDLPSDRTDPIKKVSLQLPPLTESPSPEFYLDPIWDNEPEEESDEEETPVGGYTVSVIGG